MAAQLPYYLPQDGLVAWLPFEGGVQDEGPYGNTAVDYGTAPAEDRFGQPNAARHFEDTRVELSNNASIDQFKTVSQWTRTSSSARQVSFKQNIYQGAGLERVALTQNFNGENCHFAIKETCGSSWSYGNEPFMVSDGAWHHFVGVITPQETRLYVDGVLLSTVPIGSDDQTCSGADLIIGSEWSGVDYGFMGDIDDVALWNRPLSEEEVFGLYEAEQLVFGCQDADACNYNPEANMDGASPCVHALVGDNCQAGAAACGEGMYWDLATQTCIIANPSDTDFDGCVGMTDLLSLLSTFGVCNEIPWSCGDPLNYHGYDYETVLIGEQCWFAENLRANTFQNEDPIEPWPIEDTSVPSQFNSEVTEGSLYNWAVVIDERQLCPAGWHIPSDEDWMAMELAVGLDSSELLNWGLRGDISPLLRASTGWPDGSNGSNDFGFGAMPGGNVSLAGFNNAGQSGFWWTSTLHAIDPEGAAVGRSRHSYAESDGFSRNNDAHYQHFSIRCIQDSE